LVCITNSDVCVPSTMMLYCGAPGTRGVTTGGIIPGALNHYGGDESLQGASKSPNNVHNTAHLLPKDLRFDHGGPKLASCPGCHLTSLRPCPTHILLFAATPNQKLILTAHFVLNIWL